jgi:hypothetical protein
MCRFGSLPLQEEKNRPASLLEIRHFDSLNAHFDFLMSRSVGDSTVAIEEGMKIQI